MKKVSIIITICILIFSGNIFAANVNNEFIKNSDNLVIIGKLIEIDRYPDLCISKIAVNEIIKSTNFKGKINIPEIITLNAPLEIIYNEGEYIALKIKPSGANYTVAGNKYKLTTNNLDDSSFRILNYNEKNLYQQIETDINIDVEIFLKSRGFYTNFNYDNNNIYVYKNNDINKEKILVYDDIKKENVNSQLLEKNDKINSVKVENNNKQNKFDIKFILSISIIVILLIILIIFVIKKYRK